MVDTKKERFGDTFQKHFPLKIVPVQNIPTPDLLIDFDPEDIFYYIKAVVALQVICSSRIGVGLAAVQCGIPSSLFVASEDGIQFRSFIDCEYEGVGEKIESLEGCLSLKDENDNLKRYLVKRYKKIFVKGVEITPKDPGKKFKEIAETFEGLSAIVMQHEIDHTKGLLISDIGPEVEIMQ